ncbi:MAG: ATP-binding protein [Deltaproteobacteria bacterium]|nr:ATP-binding protein [Deltaproteobacteria bacterium]
MNAIITLLSGLKPKFWEHLDSGTLASREMFNFRRIWKLTITLTSIVALLPLITLAIIDYNVTQHAIESDILLRTSRLVSNTQRAISFFLIERKAALDFLIQDNALEELNSQDRLSCLLDNLKKGFGGFIDLGVIDDSGRQNAYTGPYDLVGKDYSRQEWFQQVRDQGVYISDVYKGYRNTPHMVIAVRSDLAQGGFYVLRATLDIERFNTLLAHLEISGQGDAFLINHEGVLQTPSRHHGTVLEKLSLPVPEYSEKTTVFEGTEADGKSLIIGFRYIDKTPFILMIVKQKNYLMESWDTTRKKLIGFLVISFTLVVVVILGVTTFLVNRIFIADQKRVMILHKVEYANKMASIGRLAAGVAHEINNPLAIINENAGLTQDLLLLKSGVPGQAKLLGLLDTVISAADRCAIITHRLLNFARHVEVAIEPVLLGELITEVLGFLEKEAEYRGIEIAISVDENITDIKSDRGKLQQIFLNLFNNAFAAMSDGGKLEINVSSMNNEHVRITVADNGAGIHESDLKRIFEPFFSTKTKQGGTGLGLSITYGLIQEIGADVSVTSRVGQGTRFIITVPVKYEGKDNATHTHSFSG